MTTSASDTVVESVSLDSSDVDGSARRLRHALRKHNVIHIGASDSMATRSAATLRRLYDGFAEAVGEPVDIAEGYDVGGAPIGERWSEIAYREDVPDMVAFRHSKNAQPLHTDESYVSSSIGVMLFYCVHAAPAGGETIFVDGPALLRYLEQSEPDLLQKLLSVPVTYQKAGDSKHRPIVEIESGGVPTFNFNYFCVEPDQAPEALALNQQFHEFCQNQLPTWLVRPVAMQPGDGVAWRDDRVLHGRNSFTATKTNDRLIWKTGIVLSGEPA